MDGGRAASMLEQTATEEARPEWGWQGGHGRLEGHMCHEPRHGTEEVERRGTGSPGRSKAAKLALAQGRDGWPDALGAACTETPGAPHIWLWTGLREWRGACGAEAGGPGGAALAVGSARMSVVPLCRCPEAGCGVQGRWAGAAWGLCALVEGPGWVGSGAGERGGGIGAGAQGFGRAGGEGRAQVS